MSNLIKKLTDVNIKYEYFNDIASYIRGVSYSKNKENNIDDNGIKLLRANNIVLKDNSLDLNDVKIVDYSVKVKNEQFLKKDDILICAGSGSKEHIGKVAYINCDMNYTFGGFMGVIRAKKVNPKYLFYIMTSPIFKIHLKKVSDSSTINNINNNTWKNFKIPIPPISVQKEIVRILDNFVELTAELTAELAARKKQYKFYLNRFYGHSFDEMMAMKNKKGYDVLSLSEIGRFIRGKRFVKADSEGLTGGVPCIHYGEIYTYYGVMADKSKSYISEEKSRKLRFAHKNDVIIVGAGENNIDIGIGVAWFGEDVVVHDACYIFKHSINSKYISYYLRSDVYHNQIKRWVSEGKICAISAQGLGKAMIPVPPLEEQQRIVDILDRFDKLCNDISEGLPAEIEARQKQYEYYRDKLLTFKPLEEVK